VQTMTRMKYAEEMIEHHKNAVEMSRDLLRNYQSGYIVDFAKKVIEVQSKEIEWLKDWIKKNPSG